MKFRLWLEDFDSSVRRKLQAAVQQYLGKSFSVKAFKVDPNHGEDESPLFGKSDGVYHNGKITVKSIKSGVHELLHQAGFVQSGIGEFLNEGITQVIAEEIARASGLPVVPSYQQNTAYVRRYLIPAMRTTVKKFARLYSAATDKGKLISDLVWQHNKDKFNDVEDWGQNPYESLRRELPFIIGPFETHLNFIVDG